MNLTEKSFFYKNINESKEAPNYTKGNDLPNKSFSFRRKHFIRFNNIVNLTQYSELYRRPIRIQERTLFSLKLDGVGEILALFLKGFANQIFFLKSRKSSFLSSQGIKVPDRSQLKGKRKELSKSIAVLPFVNMTASEEMHTSL
ncbi:MAG: hypothetical protein ACI8P3_002615 [Saprospiraceae bacterium]|jgi:hypothetical protein